MTVRSRPLVSGICAEQSQQYTYVMSLPLITIYSVGNAVIKYDEGFILHPQLGGKRIQYMFRPSNYLLKPLVIPKPYTQWAKVHQDSIFPLTMVFSLGFSLEMCAIYSRQSCMTYNSRLG